MHPPEISSESEHHEIGNVSHAAEKGQVATDKYAERCSSRD